MKTKILISLFFIFSIAIINAQDTDGDGVLDSVEITDGTDPDDLCSFVLANQTETPSGEWNDTDCDSDGLVNVDEIYYDCNPLNPDTDGDGVLDGTEVVDGTDPLDFCNFVFANITLPANSVWQDADCDGDGVYNGQELIDSTNPLDLCSFEPTSIFGTPSSIWQNTDCDGDGVINAQEIEDDTNPLNPCDFVLSSISIAPTIFCSSNTITGTALFDTDGDGCDASDIPMPHVRVESDNGTFTFATFTNASGDFTQYTDEGTYETSLVGLPFYYTTTPGTHTSEFIGEGGTDNVDFCISSSETVRDVVINIIPSGEVRPGFDVSYKIIYSNTGTTVLDGNVTFEYDDSKLEFISASETHDFMPGILSFDYTSLTPLEERTIDLDFTIFAPPTTEIGDVLSFIATANPITDDSTPEDNVLNFNQTLIGSYDPNDIHVLEGNQVKYSRRNQYLHYLIRFQNMGTADAINIVVLNKLDANLDWDTLQLEQMSHEGRVAIFNGNQIEFIFEDIHLPDNTTDEPGSHGFIAYKIKPKSDIEIGDIISNQAHIFFDYNEAIDTNIETTEFVDDIGIADGNINNQVQLFPIPATDEIRILTNDMQIVEVEIWNVLGQLVKSEIKDNITNLSLVEIKSGIYTIKLKNNKGEIAVKKIIKE